MGESRSPRKLIPKVCDWCGQKYTAFRESSRFHSPACARKFRHRETDRKERDFAVNTSGGVCGQCGGQAKSLYYREVDEVRKVLCGKCNALESHKKFYQRVAQPGKGYAHKVYTARKHQDTVDLELPHSPGVYAIRHLETGREYIGRANDLLERYLVVKSSLVRGRHRNAPLQRDWSYGGPEAFTFEVLKVVPDRHFLRHEAKLLLEERRPYYNVYGLL